MTAGGAEPATLPPPGLPGLDARWSRLVAARDSDGVPRTWHVLDTHAERSLDDVRLTLLCVHGNPTWSYLWRRLLSEAPDGVRVVAVDQLDMGYSERTHTVHRLGDRVADLGARRRRSASTARWSPWPTTGAARSPSAGRWPTATSCAGSSC